MTTKIIAPSDWILRWVDHDINDIQSRILELDDKEALDYFNPPAELLSKLTAITDAIAEAQDYIIGLEQENDENQH
jgi:hypothetical protein